MCVFILSNSSILSNVVRRIPFRLAKTRDEADLQGFAKRMRDGSIPGFRTRRISSMEAQSKFVPSSAREFRRVGSELHFIAGFVS